VCARCTISGNGRDLSLQVQGEKVPACFVWWLVSHTDEWVKLDKAHAFFMFLLSSVVDNHEDVQVVEDSIY
jgi:hypothetical protein